MATPPAQNPDDNPAPPSAGPRPLSDRQKAKQAENRRDSRHENQNARIFDAPPAAPRPMYGSPAPPAVPSGQKSPRRAKPNAKNVKAVRDASTTHLRRVRPHEARANRRRVNYPRLFLGWATTALVLEVIAAALWSPRLWVKSITIEGNTTVPAERLLARLQVGPRENLVRVSPAGLQKAAEAEPTIEWAEVKRSLPPSVHVFVRERTPWASVKVSGVWYTIDRNLVPFRRGAKPEVRLPLLVLSGSEAAAAPVLGQPMTAPGLADVSRCLAWSASQLDFPLESVQIDPQGKLCLNKVGGLPVFLGSGVDLDKKLKTLALLLETRPELKGEQPAQINLLAWDAPSVVWRASLPAAPVALPAATITPVSPGEESVP